MYEVNDFKAEKMLLSNWWDVKELKFLIIENVELNTSRLNALFIFIEVKVFISIMSIISENSSQFISRNLFKNMWKTFSAVEVADDNILQINIIKNIVI